MYFFWEDRKTFFAGMDRMVALCEEYQIGIIASLVWTPLPYMTEGQTWGDFLGNPDAEGYRQMLEYIEAVVTRYKHSPAIWGWEVGNEFNLACDVDNHQLGARMLAEFYQDVTARIREWDGTGPGSSPPAIPRIARLPAPDGRTGLDAGQRGGMRFMLELYETPQMSVTSTHVYNREQHVGSRSGTIEEYLRLLTGFCRDMGKPLFVGEYCDDEEPAVGGGQPGQIPGAARRHPGQRHPVGCAVDSFPHRGCRRLPGQLLAIYDGAGQGGQPRICRRREAGYGLLLEPYAAVAGQARSLP